MTEKETKKEDKIVVLSTLLTGAIAIEVLRVGAFKRGLRLLTGRDVSWKQALWVTVMLRSAGGLFEEGRKHSADHSESLDKIKAKYGIK